MNEPFHPEPSEHELMASLFVDGAADPAEAGQVSASTELSALAAVFETMRSTLADLPPSIVDARNTAVSAALAEFDAMQAAGAGGGHAESGRSAAAALGTAPNVIRLGSRRRFSARVLTAAAAVVGLGVVGIAAFGGRGGSDDQAATDATAASERAEIAVAGGADEQQADQFVASTIGAINSAADPVVAVNSPAQLGDFVDGQIALKTQAPDASMPDDADSSEVGMNSPALRCLTDDQVFVADIIYAGAPAIAARDTVSGVTQAIDEQCNVLAEVAP